MERTEGAIHPPGAKKENCSLQIFQADRLYQQSYKISIKNSIYQAYTKLI